MMLVRHAESEFNVVYRKTGVDPGIVDPPLTPDGRRQAADLARQLNHHTIDRLVCSPYTRALETAEIIAGELGLAIAVETLVCERQAFTCDIGSHRSLLVARWPHLDFDHLDEQWWSAEAESEDSVIARGAAFRGLAASWPDHERVAVVTHWGFIRALTGQTVKNGEIVPFDPA